MSLSTHLTYIPYTIHVLFSCDFTEVLCIVHMCGEGSLVGHHIYWAVIYETIPDGTEYGDLLRSCLEPSCKVGLAAAFTLHRTDLPLSKPLLWCTRLLRQSTPHTAAYDYRLHKRFNVRKKKKISVREKRTKTKAQNNSNWKNISFALKQKAMVHVRRC